MQSLWARFFRRRELSTPHVSPETFSQAFTTRDQALEDAAHLAETVIPLKLTEKMRAQNKAHGMESDFHSEHVIQQMEGAGRYIAAHIRYLKTQDV